MRGSGGAMGCVAKDKLLISPSALQKERLKTYVSLEGSVDSREKTAWAGHLNDVR